MPGNEMSNTDPQIARQPSATDPQEIRIRSILDNLASNQSSKEMVQKLTFLQTNFLKESLGTPGDNSNIEHNYRTLLNELAEVSKSHIVSGIENLSKLKDVKHFIIATNHFGSAKITRIPSSLLNTNISLTEIEPFPIRHAPFIEIQKITGNKIFECAVELPQPFSKIQKESGVIIIPSSGEGRTQKLINSVNECNSKENKTAIVMYPEGGTTGKRNMGGAYDLDEFHSGTFVVAAKLRLPILPVCQIFDPNEGIKLVILNPINVSEKDLDKISEQVENLKIVMQKALKENS